MYPVKQLTCDIYDVYHIKLAYAALIVATVHHSNRAGECESNPRVEVKHTVRRVGLQRRMNDANKGTLVATVIAHNTYTTKLMNEHCMQYPSVTLDISLSYK